MRLAVKVPEVPPASDEALEYILDPKVFLETMYTRLEAMTHFVDRSTAILTAHNHVADAVVAGHITGEDRALLVLLLDILMSLFAGPHMGLCWHNDAECEPCKLKAKCAEFRWWWESVDSPPLRDSLNRMLEIFAPELAEL